MKIITTTGLFIICLFASLAFSNKTAEEVKKDAQLDLNHKSQLTPFFDRTTTMAADEFNKTFKGMTDKNFDL